jgi:hypothetical protein
MTKVITNDAHNSVIAKLRVTPQDKAFRSEVLELVLKQWGTKDHWVVTQTSSLQTHNWAWSDRVIFTVEGAASSCNYLFYNTLAAMRLQETKSYKVEMTTTFRPVGIRDPADPLYPNCNFIQRTIEYKNLGHCYNAGRIEFSRCNGEPLTEDDLVAINNLRYGQTNVVKGSVGDLTAEYYYEVDTSD